MSKLRSSTVYIVNMNCPNYQRNFDQIIEDCAFMDYKSVLQTYKLNLQEVYIRRAQKPVNYYGLMTLLHKI